MSFFVACLYFVFYIKFYLANGLLIWKYPFLNGVAVKTSPGFVSSMQSIIPIATTNNNSDIQEILFGELLEHVSKLQNQIATTNKVIIYKVNNESGLGNVIVGLVSSFVAAVASNRGIQSIFFSLIRYS